MGARDRTNSLDDVIRRLAAGDAAARDAVVSQCVDRISKMARRQLRAFPAVRRWEQTDDVVQNVVQRLYRALGEVRPKTSRELMGDCGELIRRELIDLKRHH